MSVDLVGRYEEGTQTIAVVASIARAIIFYIFFGIAQNKKCNVKTDRRVIGVGAAAKSRCLGAWIVDATAARAQRISIIEQREVQ